MPSRPRMSSRPRPTGTSLRWVAEGEPGFTRLRAGKGFCYRTGKRVLRARGTIARIEALRIPPAWIDVWICRTADGHIQATGRDARGRKQYRYHAEWTRVRGETKFAQLVDFATVLPTIRRRVKRDLALPGLTRDRVLAAVVAVMDRTGIRVGNDEYARTNGSFGLTTLRDRHAVVRKGVIRLSFRGKSGRRIEASIEDPALARIVARCRDLPGEELFQYVDEDGNVRDVGAADVNEYLARCVRGAWTAKVFRTWHATVLAAVHLHHAGAAKSRTAARKRIIEAIDAVAAALHNTRAVCRSYYVHPAILEAYEAGSLRLPPAGRRAVAGLRPQERAVVAFLTRQRAAA